uniref:sulfotransferase family protein n=1 Tax=Microbulbifer agarilyticus TaxID=260552 RepID=UPI000255B93A|nr:sulfotransferase family protein [Microbulbifer agarilyticus]
MSGQGVRKLGALFTELESISELLEKSEVDSAEPVIFSGEPLSLIEQLRLHSQESESKPVIRTLHHFACTGGTLISKCFSALPNVFLLSEVHPHSELEPPPGRPKFAPSDLIRMARYASIPNIRELSEKIFESSLNVVFKHVEERGGVLVLREHVHSDFCVGSEIPSKSTLISILQKQFRVVSVATIRNPIDSFLSIQNHGWVHFEPSTFDEYCRRYLEFLKGFSQDNIFRYEDFVQDPKNVLGVICDYLKLNFDENFVQTFDQFRVTGDSGRQGGKIEARQRRKGFESELVEMKRSVNYQIFCDLYNY